MCFALGRLLLAYYQLATTHSYTFSPSALNPHVLRAFKITMVATRLQIFTPHSDHFSQSSLLIRMCFAIGGLLLAHYQLAIPHSCTFSPSAPNPHVLRAWRLLWSQHTCNSSLFIIHYSLFTILMPHQHRFSAKSRPARPTYPFAKHRSLTEAS